MKRHQTRWPIDLLDRTTKQ